MKKLDVLKLQICNYNKIAILIMVFTAIFVFPKSLFSQESSGKSSSFIIQKIRIDENGNVTPIEDFNSNKLNKNFQQEKDNKNTNIKSSNVLMNDKIPKKDSSALKNSINENKQTKSYNILNFNAPKNIANPKKTQPIEKTQRSLNLNASSKEIERQKQINAFFEKQKSPLVKTNQELFLIDNLIWQRSLGKKEFFLSPSVINRQKYKERITQFDGKSLGVKKSSFEFVNVNISEKSIMLLYEMNIVVPNYIKNEILVYLPIIDIEILQSENIQLSIIDNYINTKDIIEPKNTTKGTTSVIWSEDFEGSFPGSSYSVGDSDSGSGEDYWDDVSCESHGGSWSIWCADTGDQPDCVNYDDDMEAYVYKTTGVDVSGYSNVEFDFYRKYETEATWDYLKRYYSPDGSSWTLSYSWDGNSNGWGHQTVTLNNFSTYYWKFIFDSDISNNNYQGAYLDDMQITGDASGGDPNLTEDGGSSTLSVSGTNVNMNVGIINNGNTSAGSSELGYYISSNTNITTSDWLIGTDYVSSLSAGSSTSESINVDVNNVTPTIPPGTYYCGFIIDHLDQVAESNENDNNFYWSSPQVMIGGDPNLTEDGGSSTLSVSGTNVNMNVDIINNGNASAGSSELGYYLSANTIFTTSDWLIGTDNVTSLSAGSSTSESINVDVNNVTPTIPPGDYYCGFIIDHLDQVAESNENDNDWYWSSPQVTILAGNPNLKIDASTATLAVTGTMVTVNVDVINDGGSTAGSSELGYYLSTNTIISTSDWLFGTDPVTSLAPGGSSPEIISVDVTTVSPTIPIGTYYVGVYVDHLNQVAESNEGDNTGYWSSPQVMIGGDPDINVTPTSLTINQSGKDSKTNNNALLPCDKTLKPALTEYVFDTIINKNGDTIVGIIVPYIPPQSEPIASPSRSAVMLSNIPAFDWCFGCSATSAAMAVGYYDNNGFTDMYNGPTNGGVCPMDNSIWPDVVINGENRHQCPISATHNGLDGRTSRGNVDDYWIEMDDPGPDPFITNNWTEHSWNDCTADYMGTNQSEFQNVDGSTTFYFSNNGAPLNDYTGCEPGHKDGCHGLKEFYESRGYTVNSNYSQYIYGYNGNSQGFTLTDYHSEIDAGRPVLIQVSGHTMLGVGYETGSSDIIYLHDTWNYSIHSMNWGGSYSGMQHYGMTIVELDATSTTSNGNFTIENIGTDNLSINSISDNKNWLSTSGYPSTPFTIIPNSSQQVTVTVDWNLMGSGTETGTITIASDDPDEPTVTVTVTAIPLTNTLSVLPSNRNVSSSAGNTTFSISSNTSWTVSDDAGWLTVSPTSGSNNGSLTATFTENTGSQRVGTITVSGTGVSSVNVTVTQAGPGLNLTVTPSNQNVGAPAGNTTFSISSNTSWTVSDNAGWLTVSPTSGSNNGTLSATFTENTSSSQRIGTITVSASGLPDEIVTVTQDGTGGTNTHFTPVWSGYPYQPMTIIVNSANINGIDLQTGDEVGVFDVDGSGNLICVGVGELTTPITSGNPLTITVSADDPTTNDVDGFTNGNTIIYKLWDSNNQMEFSNVSASYNLSFDQVFTTLGTAIVELTGYAHFQTIWSGNPYQPMNILISSATIDGAAFNIGDEIGVFDVDGSGNEICVGVGIVTSAITSSNPLSIIASTDDPNTSDIDGFTSGNTIIYKAWSSSAQTEYSTYQATYNPAFDNSYTPLGTALVDVVFLSYITQTIELNLGWNIMSFYVTPTDMNLLNILQQLVTSNELIKVIDEAGGFIQNIPGVGWMNTIGNMENTEGYYIKVTNNTSFDATGNSVSSPFCIPLNQGWNIIGYPFEQSQDALTALQPLINAGELIKVIDEAGGFIQFIPGVGWMNTIGNFEADEGYYIKITTNASLCLTSTSSSASTTNNEANQPCYFKSIFENNPYYPMNVVITAVDIQGHFIQSFDEIAVYDNDVCVGVGIIPEDKSKPLCIAVSLDDPTTAEIDGYTTGHKLIYKYMSPTISNPLNLFAKKISGAEIFEPLETFVCALSSPNNVDELNGENFVVNIYPNPVKNKVNIEIENFKEGQVQIEVINLFGKTIEVLYYDLMQSGNYRLTYGVSQLASGIYTIRLIHNANSVMSVRNYKLIVTD